LKISPFYEVVGMVEEWEPNFRKFRAVCQKCGKTGFVDFKKSAQENGFILMFWEYGDEYGGFEVEYYLCLDCYNRLFGVYEDERGVYEDV